MFPLSTSHPVSLKRHLKHLYGLLVLHKVLEVETSSSTDSNKENLNDIRIHFRLAITTINEPLFNHSSHDALFAMFDGGLNDEVPNILKHKLCDTIQNEYESCPQANVYLKHTFLTLQK